MAINVEDYSAHLTSMRSLVFFNILYGTKEHKVLFNDFRCCLETNTQRTPIACIRLTLPTLLYIMVERQK